MPSAAARARKTGSWTACRIRAGQRRRAQTGRGDDPDQDQQRRQAAEHAHRRAGRNRRLPSGAAQSQERRADRHHDRQHQEDRDHFQRLPGGWPWPKRSSSPPTSGSCADPDFEPREEHQDEEQDRGDQGDRLARPQPPSRLHRPSVRARAASRVLWRSIAIVIGPTPPGTGVIAAATSAAGS